jgi:Spy/CpxP family protein refolding chaperone
MDKIKVLSFAVIALLLLNFGTLGFLLLSGPKHDRRPPHRMPKEIIIDKLQLDTNQQAAYQTLIDWHRGTIDSLDQQIRSTKNDLYLQLTQKTINIKTKDSLIEILASNQKKIEETHFKHFQDIKNLCKPNQMNSFNELTEELSRIFGRKPKPRHD